MGLISETASDIWAKEDDIDCVYRIPSQASAFGKIKRCNGLLETTLRAMGTGTGKNWDENLAEASWLVNARGCAD